MRTFLRCFISILLLLAASAPVKGLAQEAKSPDNEAKAKEYYQMGNFYYQQGRYKEAEEQYQKAMELLKDIAPAAPVITGPAAAKPAERSPASAGVSDYIIGVDDVLAISVWQNADLNQETVVRPDGKISFPLIGDVVASGMTIPALDDELTVRLKEFVRFPEVSISLKKMGGSRVIVLGEVVSPGVYSVSGSKTALEAVGLAGGFTIHAVASSVVLIRGGIANPKPAKLNLTKALRGEGGQNVVLQAEDVVFVPKKTIADVSYFLSQVIDPLARGAYTAKQFKEW